MIALRQKSTASLLDCHRWKCRWFEICWRMTSIRSCRKQGRSAAFAMRDSFRDTVALPGTLRVSMCVMYGSTSSFHQQVCSSYFGIRQISGLAIFSLRPLQTLILSYGCELRQGHIHPSIYCTENLLQSGITNPQGLFNNRQPAHFSLLSTNIFESHYLSDDDAINTLHIVSKTRSLVDFADPS